MKLTTLELNSINGGGLSATMINAIARGASVIYNVGQALGSALRRFFTKSYC